MHRHPSAIQACAACVLGGIIRCPFRALLSAALAVLVIGSPSVAQNEEQPSITFGVLRQDGILIPFATLDRQWKNLWPVPRRSPEVPVTLDDVPKRWWPGERPQIEWTRWMNDGDSAPLRVLAPTWFRAQCLSNVGLRTDFTAPGRPVPPDATPFPKAGVATSVSGVRGLAIEPVVILDDGSQDWRTIVEIIRAPFDKAENQAVRGQYGWGHPVPNRDREKHPIGLEGLYRVGDAKPGTFVYYVEAVRRYAAIQSLRGSPDEPCDLITYAKGWVRVDPRGRSYASVVASMTDCYRWNVSFTYPLGVVRLSTGSPLWIVQTSSWSAESYAVIEVLESAMQKVLIETTGGWCQ